MRFKYLLLLLPFLVLNCAKDKGQSRPLDSFVGPDAVLVLKINHLGQFRDSLESNDFLTRLEDLEPYGTVLQNLRFLSHLQQELPRHCGAFKIGIRPMALPICHQTVSRRLRHRQLEGQNRGDLRI